MRLFKRRRTQVALDPKTDPDLLRWAEISVVVQQDSYSGIVGWIQDLGHRVLERLSRVRAGPAIEIGCGTGRHFGFLNDRQEQMYYGLDISLNHLRGVSQRFENVTLLQGDAYELPFRDNSVSKIYAIYIFEHLRQLNKCLDEITRVLKKDGELLVAIPTEGAAWEIGRKLTTKRAIENQYGIDYDKVVRYEHCNTCWDVMGAVQTRFQLTDVQYLPFRIPTVHLNAIIAFRCVLCN